MKYLLRIIGLTVGSSIVFFLALTSTYAATRYVNSDSNGSASNPTRAFNDPSYTPNDSYATFSAAYAAASNSDIIELSGGTTGKTYVGHTASIQKILTIQGSQIANHNGTVTINYNSGGGTYTMGLNANGITVQRLTFSRQGGTSGEYALRVFLDNITIRDVTVKNTTGFGMSIESTADNTLIENLREDTSTIGGANAMTVFNSITMRNSIFYGVDITGVAGISFQSNSGTHTLDNVIFDGIASGSILVTTGTTVNLTNCVITAPGINTARSIHFNSAGTVNTTNCFIQGPIKAPHDIISGTGTWNSTNDIIGDYSYYTQTRENIGYIILQIDDRHNLDHFKTLADYAKSNYGITMSFYVHDTTHISASDKPKLQQLYLDGHEIAAHTRDHTNMGVTGPFTVTYTGAANNISFVVSASATTLSVTGSADTHGPIDLTAAANDTVGELCTTIDSWTNYTCALTGTVDAPTKDFVPSFALKDTSTNLPISSGIVIPYDDNTGLTNRFMKYEVTDSIAELEAAMHENPLTADYVAKTFGYPFSQKTAFTSTWIKNNTNLISIRGVGTDTLQEKTPLNNINLYAFGNVYTVDNIKGTGYDSLTDPEKQARFETAARAMVTFASMGMVTGYVGHNPAQDFTVQEYEWLIDEIAKYAPVANVQVKTMASMAEDIKTSGLWADQGTGFWTRTFTGEPDFRPRYQSGMINAGITTSGRTTDIAGNSLIGNPDMGAYEFQAAYAPSSLAQYKSDGSTVITSASWTNENTVVLKFSMASTNSTDLLTPEVEIRTNATSFTNVVTNTGTAVLYTGTPVIGTVTITGLSSGNQYHWQARVTNPASSTSWQAKGGTPDFGVDTTLPGTPGTPSTSTPTTDNTPTWTWTASTDLQSGLANPAYTVEWSQDSGFGSGVNSSTSNTSAFTHSSTLADGTWYFRVKSTDLAGNASAYSSNGSVLIDTTNPTAPGTPSPTTPTNDNTPTWTWTTSSESGSGLANPAYTVEWSQDSGFGSGVSSTTTNTNSFTHSSTLADGTWYFRVKSTDLAGNTSIYSANGSITIAFLDNTVPTTPGNPTTTSPTNDVTPTWTWIASTDLESGLANPAYTVEWSLSSTFSSGINSATTNLNTYTHSLNLTEGTWYFRVRATDLSSNVSNNSANGVVVIDSTIAVISAINSAVTTNSATVTWTTNENASSKVEYGLTNGYGSVTAESNTSPRVTSHSVIINGLGFCTTYHYRVRSVDSAGNESFGNDLTLTTSCQSNVPTQNSNNIGNETPVSIPTTVPTKVPTDVSVSETVTGFVVKIKIVDSVGNPIKNVKVTLVSTGISAITDSNGIATFTNIPKGEHKFIVEHPDYVGKEQIVNVEGNVNGISANVILEKTAEGNNTAKTALIVVGLVVGASVVFFVLKKSLNKKEEYQ